MDPGAVATPYDHPPVAGTRIYRLTQRWWKGPGVRAGRILPMAILAPLLILFAFSGIEAATCAAPLTYETSDSTCEANLEFLYLLTEGFSLLFLLAILSSLAARLELRIRRNRRAHRARRDLRALEQRIQADPLADRDYAALHEAWTASKTEDAPYLRAAVLQRDVAISVAPCAVFFLLETLSRFQEIGQLLPLQANLEERSYMAIMTIFLLFTLVAALAARAQRGSRLGARELRERVELRMTAMEAELIRRHERPHEAASGAGFTFKRYGHSTSVTSTKS